MSGEGLIPAPPDWESRTGRRRIPRGTVVCPVCGSDAHLHGGEHVTALVKTLWCRCTNLKCGMTWRMQLAFEYVVSPSALPSPPGLDLPRAPIAHSTGPPDPPLAPAIHGGGGGEAEDAPRTRLAS